MILAAAIHQSGVRPVRRALVLRWSVAVAAAAVGFLERHLDACEMAHADRPID